MMMSTTEAVVAVIIHIGFCQGIRWTWLEGSPQANPLQTKQVPGGRSGAVYWMDPDQQVVWMFGGEHHVEHQRPSLKNDLWRLDLTSLSWQQMHNGTSEDGKVPEARQLAAGCGVQGAYFVVYGGLGDGEKVLDDMWFYYILEGSWYRLDDMQARLGARNNSVDDGRPVDRGDAVFWCQSGFNLTVFGGFDNNNMLLHDMWTFDMQQLAWTELYSSSKLPKDPDFVSHLSYPSGRSGATTWVTMDRLYLFGGNIQHKNLRSKHLLTGNAGDMWEYSIKMDTWSYVSGSRKMCLEAGRYGSLGIASLDNFPGCRRRAASWTDTQANLWMFGGDGVDDSPASVSVFKHSKLLSDIWHFHTGTHEWTWKGGLSVGDGKGSYGGKRVAGESQLPGSRCESATWGINNSFYLFGGVGHDSKGMDGYLNDVWKLSVDTDISLTGYVPTLGTVFGLLILGLGLVSFVFIGFICNRGYFAVGNRKQKGTYRLLAMEEDNE